MNRILILTVIFLFLSFLSCDSQNHSKEVPSSKQIRKVVPPSSAKSLNQEKPPANQKLKSRQYGFEIIRTLPHDPDAFTQGLIYYKGFLYESTGLRGHSSLRKIDPATGKVLKMEKLAPFYFSEGIAIRGNKIYMLTYLSQVCLIFGLESLKLETSLSYDGEGWGLAYDGELFIMTNGSNMLAFVRPENFEVVSAVGVYDRNGPVRMINEMEYVDGEIFANVWQQDVIIIIDPQSGDVLGRIDFSNLRGQLDDPGDAEVFNGIAYNADTETFFVTGKLWDKMFEIKLIEK